MLTDTAIREAIYRGEIDIDPPLAPQEIKAARVDIRLGAEAFLGTGSEVLQLEQHRLLTIPPGELALVSVLEKIKIGPRFAAQIGLRSSFARKGLALLAGPQIDPGFRGRLHVALVNLSPVEISIPYREHLVTLIFHDLGQDAENPYGARAGDEYQEQDAITGSEIDDIRQHRGYAMSEVIREMATLSANVGELRTSVDGYITQSDKVLQRMDLYLLGAISSVVALVIFVIVRFA